MSTAEASAGVGHAVAVVANTEKIEPDDADRLRRALAAHGIDELDWTEITHGSDARKAAKKAAKRGAQTVVVCGGDGSVRAAAEGLVGTATALAVVPSGTANLFASGMHLPTDLEEIAKAVVVGDRKTIDTGTCNDKTFNIMAGSGFDVGMLGPSDSEKQELGTLAYVREGVEEVRSRKLFHVEVAIDGRPFYDGQCSCVLVGKLGTLKAGVETFPDATPTDGLLHVAVVTAVGPWDWASLIASAVLRKQDSSSEVEIGRGKAVKVRFRKKRRFELDGGIKGRTKTLKCEVNPSSLVICTLPA